MKPIKTPYVLLAYVCFAAALILHSVAYSQQQEDSYQSIRAAAEKRIAAIEQVSRDVGNAVQALTDSPGFGKYAVARHNHLAAVRKWQAAKRDKNKEAYLRRLMEDAERIVRMQRENNVALGRLLRLQKVREQIDLDYAEARTQLNRMQDIPLDLTGLDKQIATLNSASRQTDLRITVAKARNEKVKDLAIKQNNARLIARAEENAARTKDKLQELKTIRSNLQREVRRLTNGKTLEESQELLKQRQSQIGSLLKVPERKLQDLDCTLDALLFVSSSPKLNEVRGAAQVARNGNTVAARDVNSLQPGDEIKTGKSSSLALTLEDGSNLKVGSSTTIQIEKTTREMKVQVGVLGFKAKFNMLFKKWLNNVTSARRRFRVRTPGGGASFRGTEFVMQIDQEGITHIYLRSGESEMTLKGGETKQLSAGSYFTIQKDGTPGEVKQLTDNEYFAAAERLLPN